MNSDTKFGIVGAFLFAAVFLWPISRSAAILELVIALALAFVLAGRVGRR